MISNISAQEFRECLTVFGTNMDSSDIIRDIINSMSLQELDYADELIKTRRDKIHYEFVKKYLDGIMKDSSTGANRAGGSYDELQEGIILQDGQRLTVEDIKRYAIENGIQLRTKDDIFSEFLNECIVEHIKAQKGRF